MHAPERQGDWQQTFTGRMFWPLDPRPEEVDVRDIAHGLALQCRFAGHCKTFYSVAEHSVRVARWVKASFSARYPAVPVESLRRAVLAALLHDAPEAFIMDIPRPLKRSTVFRDYRSVEDRLARVIECHFALPLGAFEWSLVKEGDERLLMTEQRDLMGPAPAPWGQAQGRVGEPLPEAIKPWDWRRAEEEFLSLFGEVCAAGYPPNHFHTCPHCYRNLPCAEDCTINADLSENGVNFGSHACCDTCEETIDE